MIRRLRSFLVAACFVSAAAHGQREAAMVRPAGNRDLNFTSFPEPDRVPAAIWSSVNPEAGPEPAPAYITTKSGGPRYVEVLAKRNANERYFVNPARPAEFVKEQSYTASSYRRDGRWRLIDAHLKPAGNGVYEAADQWDPVGVDIAAGETYVRTLGKTISFNKWTLYGKTSSGEVLLARADWSRYSAGEDGVQIREIFPGIDAEMRVVRGGIKTNFIVRRLAFPQFSGLYFQDEFGGLGEGGLQFADGNAAAHAGAVSAEAGPGSSALKIQPAIVYDQAQPSTAEAFPYELHGNRLRIGIGTPYLQRHLTSGPVVIDPLVQSQNSIAQNLIGTMYNATCSRANSCDYNIIVTPPAAATITAVLSQVEVIATAPCGRQEFAYNVSSGTCTSPSLGGQWIANSGTTGPGIMWTGFYGEDALVPCMPGPSCAPVAQTFTFRLYRGCNGPAGCDNTCIGLNSPLAIRIEGRTAEYSNGIAASADSVCAGSSFTLSAKPQFGKPSYTTSSWSYSSTGTPVIGSGDTISVTPAPGTYAVYVRSTDACGTIATASKTIKVNPVPVISGVTGTDPTTCGGTNGSLSVNGLTPSTGNYTVSYYNGTSTITLTNRSSNASGTITIGSLRAGSYSSFSVTRLGCTGTFAGPVTLSPPPTPATPAPTSNSPVCAGGTINLTTPAVTSGVYAWTGPNSFSSTSQNPSIANATAAASGVYSVTVTVANCQSAPGTATVAVDPTPVISGVAGTNPGTCGGTGSITVSGLTPLLTYQINFTKNALAQTPVTAVADAAGNVTFNGRGSGTYTQFAATLGACSSAVITTIITLTDPAAPAVPAIASNSPVCAGSSLNLTGPALTGSTYQWTGPNGFSSTVQSPSILSATTAASGTYTLVVTNTATACSMASAPLTVVVDPTPVITAATGTNPATCGGATGSITLSGLTPATVYTIGYTKNTVAQSSLSITADAAGAVTLNGLGVGVYTGFVATLGACSAAPSGTVVTLTNPAAPAAPVISSNSPVCAGSSLNLSGPSLTGTTYQWTGPNGFSSTVQSPVIVSVTAAAAGAYTLVITNTATSCSASSAPLNVAVNPTPVISGVAGTDPATCNGTGSITVSGLTPSLTYRIDFTKSTVAQTPVTSVADAGGDIVISGLGTGAYTQFIATLGACSSASVNTVVTLANPAAPAVPVIASNSPVCAGSGLNLTGPALAGTSYQWTGPNGFSSTAQSPSISSATTAASGTYTLVVTNTATACSATSAPLNVVVNAIPSISGISSSNPTTCGGTSGTITLSGIVAGASYTVSMQKTPVSGPAVTVTQTLTATSAAPATLVITGLTAGTYSGMTLTLNGCSSSSGAIAAVTLSDPPIPAAPTASSNSPVCQGASLNLTATGQTGAVFSWTGPGGYTSTQRTPTVTSNMQSANTGTYSVTQSVAGCVSPAATTTVAMRSVPAAAGSITGPAAPCASTSQTYSIGQIANSTGYTWTLPSGWTITSSPPDSNAIVVTTGATPGAVTLRVATVNGCGSGTSSTLSVNVNATPAIPASINGPVAICNGVAATYISAPAARATSYNWTIPGNPGAWTGNTATNTTDTQRVTTGAGSGWVSVSASNVCGTSAPQGIWVTVTSIPSMPAPISGNRTPCFGTSQAYNTISVYGATSYTWSYPASWSSPTPAAVSNSTTAIVGSGSGQITVSASNQCGTSAAQTLNVSAVLFPGQPSAISGPTAACIGNINIYRVSPGTGGATTSYVWSLPAGWYGMSDSAAMYASAGSTAGTVTVTPIGVCGPGQSRSLAVTTAPVMTPSVSARASAGLGGVLLCQGVADTFRATAVNGGASPVYQWTKNGRIVGTGAAVYIDSSLSNGDTITVTLRSSLPCVTLSQVTAPPMVINVTPRIVPGINIDANPPTIFCEGAMLRFLTNTTGGGSAPAYRWYRNDTLIAGQTAPVYTGGGKNGDTLYVKLVSNAVCRARDTVISNKVGLQVIPTVVPTVTISPDVSFPVLPGVPVTFTAISSGGGSSPDYQWQRNGVNISFATGATYTTDQLRNGDRISVRMISSEPCATTGQVTSNELEVGIRSATGVAPGQGSASLDLYPNPTSGQFTIRVEDPHAAPAARVQIDVLNTIGQIVYKTEVVPAATRWSFSVYLDPQLAAGTYMVRIGGGSRSVVRPVTLLR